MDGKVKWRLRVGWGQTVCFMVSQKKPTRTFDVVVTEARRWERPTQN